MRAVFFIPYPLQEVPSQRFRFEQYLTLLADHGFVIVVASFYTPRTWNTLVKSPALVPVIIAISYIRIYFKLFKAIAADFVFIHREVIPIGPPIFEWLIAKVFGKRIIYDFDDAIWTTDNQNESSLVRIVRWRKKVASICRWSYRVSVGNEYLASYVRQFNNQVRIIPTTVDIANQHTSKSADVTKESDRILIGWTGSRTTLKYLMQIGQVLVRIQNRHPHVDFRVIADVPPELHIPRIDFVRWNKQSEITDLAALDIGIMPLPDDEWSKGKCGFKAIQYMALEIPCLASPVGVNSEIITHGLNGFLCKNEEEWVTALDTLIKDKSLRIRVGREGRKKIIADYSVDSVAPRFLSLFE